MSLLIQAQRSPHSVDVTWLVGATPSRMGIGMPRDSDSGLGFVTHAAPTALVIAVVQATMSPPMA
jgi:hypothetical protein